ncbi:hypothetical protein QAD02_018606 [Eretmocerus hayati]|uniref:Uncharacterized protein n=1 Tax=Eretmocerus hayati TaxID=131215 RepID=A0ACC2PHN3_9HYME|nr:hypothetical protein QAD02_018606 [Eretmocerus hayati]
MSKRRGDFIKNDEIHLYHQKTREKFQEKMEEGRKNLAGIQKSDFDDWQSAPEKYRDGSNNVPDSYGPRRLSKDLLQAEATENLRLHEFDDECSKAFSRARTGQLWNDSCSSKDSSVGVPGKDQKERNLRVHAPATTFCAQTEKMIRCGGTSSQRTSQPPSQSRSLDDCDATEHLHLATTSQSCGSSDKTLNISRCSRTIEASNLQPVSSSAVANNSTTDHPTDHSDIDDVEEVMRGFSQKFNELLSVIIFPSSKISVEDVLNMTQAIYLRYKIPIQAKLAILELIKVLAGPEFKNLNLSEYYVSKFNKPIEDNKLYTFYCTECNKTITEPLLRKDFT